MTGTHDEAAEHRPFPALADAFKYVSEETGSRFQLMFRLYAVSLFTGFNIELKYAQEYNDGGHECENYFEHNLFVDTILDQVRRFAGARRIVFSSFDPTICTIVTLKQNLYPVLFLNQGQTIRYVSNRRARKKKKKMSTSRFGAFYSRGRAICAHKRATWPYASRPAPVLRASTCIARICSKMRSRLRSRSNSTLSRSCGATRWPTKRSSTTLKASKSMVSLFYSLH